MICSSKFCAEPLSSLFLLLDLWVGCPFYSKISLSSLWFYSNKGLFASFVNFYLPNSTNFNQFEPTLIRKFQSFSTSTNFTYFNLFQPIIFKIITFSKILRENLLFLESRKKPFGFFYNYYVKFFYVWNQKNAVCFFKKNIV